MTFSRIICLLILLGLLLPSGALATQPQPPDKPATGAFRSRAPLLLPDISIPTVFEIPLQQRLNENSTAVLDMTSQTFQPFTVFWKTNPTRYTITVQGNSTSSEEALTDTNSSTFADYPLGTAPQDSRTFRFHYAQPITTSRFNFQLAANVQEPDSIHIDTLSADTRRIIVAPTRLIGTTISFPETTAADWEVTLLYSQPLRITGMDFEQESEQQTSVPHLRFLAQPDTSYTLYADPDRLVSTPLSESGMLSQAPSPFRLPEPVWQHNPTYAPADRDNDGILDTNDNCPMQANPDQADVNKSGMGDACEDFDVDGILNSRDNCPNIPNQMQQDSDGDSTGDHCDTEESRLTEKYAWLPWLGIVAGFAIVGTLLAVTIRSHDPNKKMWRP